jgi:integrase
MTTSRRGRPPTGCPEWNPEKQIWEARLWLSSGQRRPVAMRGIAEHEVERAKAVVKGLALRARDGGFVPEDALESVNEWFGRYYKAAEKGDVGRKNRGQPQVTAGDRQKRFENWISPIIGVRPMAVIGPDELRAVVRRLDEQIRIRTRFYDQEPTTEKRKGRKPGLAAKAARNIWGECTAGFREASSSKIESLRVRTDDPTRAVQPPMTTDDRAMAALYPSELLMLLVAPKEKVPTYRKINYAVAAYSGDRVGELRGLVPESLDLEHAIINVRKQRRAGKKGEAKLSRTKTSAGRRQVPMEANLGPLLRVLAEVTNDGEPLLRIPPAEDCAEKVRDDLTAAGCDREELFADDAERQPFAFHGLRHTCLTRWAVAGKGAQWLSAAGHTDLATTMGYVDVAVMLSGSFGQPHPPQPRLCSPKRQIQNCGGITVIRGRWLR